MITRYRFRPKSPNLHQTCILGYSQLVLKVEVIDLDLQGHFGHFDSEFQEFWLVRSITFNGFELKSPNLHQICNLGFSQLVLKMGGIDLDLQGHLAIRTHKTTFNVTFVHWSRPAKGCYTSQTCSCVSCCQQKNVSIFEVGSQQFCRYLVSLFDDNYSSLYRHFASDIDWVSIEA